MIYFNNLLDLVTGIYDLTVGFKRTGAEPTLISMMRGRSCQAEIFARAFPVEQIPKDTNECANWIHKLYQEKDEIYDTFVRHDTFENHGLTRIEIPRNCYDLLIELGWISIIGLPSIYYLIKFLCTSSLLAQLIFLFLTIVGK